jgi:hypothetical protein
MRASTAKLHAAILAEIGTFRQPTPQQQALLERVEREYYHDFFGEPAMPMLALVIAARDAGLPGIAAAVPGGAFDATREEAEEWGSSAEGRSAFAELLRGLPDPEED